MSYHCQRCDKQHFGPARRVVTKIRTKLPPQGGTEIVEEKYLCIKCAKETGPPQLLPPQPHTPPPPSYDERRPRRQYEGRLKGFRVKEHQ